MARWTIALVMAAAVGYVGVYSGRRWAFEHGWFERRTQTRRRRSHRRPTHGGVVLAAAIAAGSAVAGPGEPVARAVVLACIVSVVFGARAERGKGQTWIVQVGRVATAAAVPAMGLRAGITGSAAGDVICTALIALALMAGVRAIERTDGTAPLVAAISAAGMLLVSIRGGSAVVPAAAVVGACGALVATTWPPALVRIGVIGPTVLGASLTAVGIELEVGADTPRSALLPAFCLATIAAGVFVRGWDRRLARRHLRPRLVLPLAALAGAGAAVGLDREWLGTPAAAALALVPVVVLVVVALSAPRPAREGTRRVPGVVIGGALVVLGALAVVAGLMALDARQTMARGRESAVAGLDAARDGDLETAQQYFEIADEAFADAGSTLDNPLMRAGKLVPLVGPNLHNARTLAAVGGDLSSTAIAVAERAGADDLLMVDGRFPVDAARAVSDDLNAALQTLWVAEGYLVEAVSPYLLPEVRRGSEEVEERIVEAQDSLEVVAHAANLVPWLLGAEGDRRWVVAVLTPSEERGAGGLAGDFAELRASEGDISLVDTHPAPDLNEATDPAVRRQTLPPVYSTQYSGFFPARYWQNLSATPDVPTFATAIATGFPELPFGGPVDGVVTIDPYGIAALLELSGPVTVEAWPEPISADNAAQILLFDHYDRFVGGELETFQSAVVEALVEKLTSGTLPPPSEVAATLAPAVAGGHLRLWSPADDAQLLFEQIGADGALTRPAQGDFVQLITQNRGGNKIDWFMRRELAYAPTFDPSTGRLSATASVTITNTAPTSGVNSYIIGADTTSNDPGDNRVSVTIATPHRAVRAIDSEGRPVALNYGREQGLYMVTALLNVPAGGSATITFELDGRIEPTDGSYRLRVGHQPTVMPDTVSVDLAAAPEWVVVRPEAGGWASSEDAALELHGTLRPR